jgi:glycerol-3-phosphate acyltransferase PlsX
LKIVVDAMGGDHAPEAIIAGVVDALNEFDVSIALVGIESRVRDELKKYSYDESRVEIIHADQVVEMNDPAAFSIRKKKNSSISVGIDLLKTDGYDAFVSAGNTGAVVAASTIKLRMLKGVDRPAIGITLPTLNGFSFLIDVGANTAAKAENLKQQAIMAQVYMQEVLNIKKPTVGLLNIGEEDTKGSSFEKEAHKLLEESVEGFIGNVEASGVYKGVSDCIVCDGYTGNIVIKVSTGLLEVTGSLIKREVKKNPIAILGALLMKKTLKHIKKHADYSEYGGAPLLGVDGIVMISHGRSNPKAIKNAIRATMTEVEHDINGAISRALNTK